MGNYVNTNGSSTRYHPRLSTSKHPMYEVAARGTSTNRFCSKLQVKRILHETHPSWIALARNLNFKRPPCTTSLASVGCKSSRSNRPQKPTSHSTARSKSWPSYRAQHTECRHCRHIVSSTRHQRTRPLQYLVRSDHRPASRHGP